MIRVAKPGQNPDHGLMSPLNYKEQETEPSTQAEEREAGADRPSLPGFLRLAASARQLGVVLTLPDKPRRQSQESRLQS